MALSAYLAVRVPFASALRHSLRESAAKYSLAEWLAERPYDDDLAQQRLTAAWLEARGAAFRVALLQQAVLYGVQVVFGAGLLLVGGQLVIQGQLTLGQLVAAELVTATALLSLGKLGKQLPKVYDLLTSFEKVGLLVDQPLAAPDAGPIAGREGA
jgi:hypothetical protein